MWPWQLAKQTAGNCLEGTAQLYEFPVAFETNSHTLGAVKWHSVTWQFWRSKPAYYHGIKVKIEQAKVSLYRIKELSHGAWSSLCSSREKSWGCLCSTLTAQGRVMVCHPHLSGGPDHPHREEWLSTSFTIPSLSFLCLPLLHISTWIQERAQGDHSILRSAAQHVAQDRDGLWYWK